MTQNVLQIWPEIVGIAGGGLVLLLFALTIALPHRTKALAGSGGPRPPQEQGGHEAIRPDGYVDSYAKEIEAGAGAMPIVVRLALPGVLLWWLIYLILNWAPR